MYHNSGIVWCASDWDGENYEFAYVVSKGTKANTF